MTKRWLHAALAASIVLTGGDLRAATATYGYDALGRLTRVSYPDGKVTVYKYDDAGNRTQVVSGTLAGIPASISVPSSSTGSYTISWGVAPGTVTAYELYQATNTGFSGQTLAYSGTALSVALSGRPNGTYYYRVRACFVDECGAYRTGSNGVVVTAAIEVLNPSIQVGSSGQVTQITTLANLNGIPATIQSFSENCGKASVTIQSGAQAITWTNSNTYYYQCDVGVNQQCTANYVIRNSSTGQLHPGTSAITVRAQAKRLPAGTQCP